MLLFLILPAQFFPNLLHASCCTRCQCIFDRGISHTLYSFCIQCSKVFEHPLWLQDVLMIIWENHQNHRKFTVAEEQLHLEPKLL